MSPPPPRRTPRRAPAAPSGDPPTEAYTRFPAIYAQLRASRDVAQLLARAALAVVQVSAFERAVVLTVGDGRLTAEDTGVIEHGPSDQLRRRTLAAPVPLVPSTEEAELVRRASAEPRAPLAGAPSALAEALGLERHGYGAVVADGQTVGLLVADRPGDGLAQDERLWLQLMAAMLAVAVEHVVMRRRIEDLAGDLRDFTTSTQALVREVAEGAVVFPSHRAGGPALARVGSGTAPDADLHALFSARELRVAELLVAGRTNREIAEELVVSPETVKTHVARILRKLGAHNRVEAVGIFLRLREG